MSVNATSKKQAMSEAKRQPLGNLSNEVERNGSSQKKSTLPSKISTEKKAVEIAKDDLPDMEYMPPPHTEDRKYSMILEGIHVGVILFCLQQCTCRVMAYCIVVSLVLNKFIVTP